jgi:RNA 3'-terminal phosphate cyclase (ATP)
VAADVVAQVQALLAAEAPVGPYLADQLLLPMALGEGGRFFTVEPTPHTRTQAEVLRLFLGTRVRFRPEQRGWWIEVEPNA